MAAEEDFDPRGAIDSLRANLEQPDKFSDIFCNAAKTQKSIDNVLKDTIRELLKHDKETLEHVKNVQRQVNKEDIRNIIKQIGWGGWTLITVIITAIITSLIRKYIG